MTEVVNVYVPPKEKVVHEVDIAAGLGGHGVRCEV